MRNSPSATACLVGDTMLLGNVEEKDKTIPRDGGRDFHQHRGTGFHRHGPVL